MRADAPVSPEKTPLCARVKKAQKPPGEHLPVSSVPERMIR